MGGSGRDGREDGGPPRERIVGLGGVPHDFTHFGDWEIFWKVGTNKAGVLEVNFICRTPHAAPLSPDRTQVMEIFGSRCNHVEREPKFVSTASGWRNWVLTLSSKVCRIQSLLLSVAPECGCDPWLDARHSAEVYEALREWLKCLDERA
jgi:hypothetical protein